MSKQSKEKEFLESLILNRTVGLEIEGYISEYPRSVANNGGIPYTSIKSDASLQNSSWHYSDRKYGLEVVTIPLQDLRIVGDVYSNLKDKGYGLTCQRGKDGNAGLHVHVDTSDFSFHDKIKAIWFAKGVEDIMYMLVRGKRYDNRYCTKISKGWSTIVNDTNGLSNIGRDYASLISALCGAGKANNYNYRITHSNTRYLWLNALRTHYPTIEFRIFNAVRTSNEAIRYAYLAHNFINTVKNSTIEQLKFIVESIEQEPIAENKIKKFLDALGIPYNMRILGHKARVQAEIKTYVRQVAVAMA